MKKNLLDILKQIVGISLGWIVALIIINYVGIYIVGTPVRRCYEEEKVCCYLWGPRLSCVKMEQLPENAPELR